MPSQIGGEVVGRRAELRLLTGALDRAGLGDEGVAFGNAGVARLECGHFIGLIRAANGQPKSSTSCVCEIALVYAHSLPAFLVAQFHQHAGSLFPAFNQIKVGLQSGGVLSKKFQPILKRFTYGRQPLARIVGERQGGGRL